MKRFALTQHFTPRSRVHQVESDDNRNSFCGVACSLKDRFSRRTVEALKGLRDCRNCEGVLARRKKRAARKATR